jgi:hypothetical protein
VTKAVSAFDYVVSDSVSYTKSYSPLFFTMFQRRVPVVYKTLGILDTAIIKDTASAVLIKKVSVGDSLLADSYDIRNLAVHASDIVTVADYGTAVKAKVLDALDYISAADNVDLKKAVAVTALEKLITDYVTYTKSYSPLFFSILRRKTPIVYKTLSVLDVIAVKDSASVIPIRVVSVFDSMVVSDHATAKMISIPVSDFIMYDSVVPISYVALSVFDIVSLPDSVSVVVRKVVSVSDFIMYDYVPSMSPSDIIYMGLYSNPRTYGLSVSETGIVYDSAAVVKKTLDVLDKVIYDKADLYLL